MNLIKLYEEKIDNTSQKYIKKFLPDTTENLANKVTNIVVILTSSRSGSSLFKDTLTQSKDVLFTDGEETPYLILTKNEFPFVASDSLTIINNKNKLLSYIFSDLGKRGYDDINNIYINCINRIMGQLPFECGDITEMADKFETILAHNYSIDSIPFQFLKEVFNSNILSFYDYFKKDKGLEYNNTFNTFPKIEDPPFIIPECKNNFTIEDLKTKPLIFKTPENAYKIGIFEKLFPNANIKYIYLTRGFAQTVNGLMDGWQYPYGFFSKNLKLLDIPLKIKNYSENHSFGKYWWNFDFPPNWPQYINTALKDVCINQWASVHEHILDKINSYNYVHIKFEDFIQNPQKIIYDICQFIGIQYKQNYKLKNVMITDNPMPYRWKKRKDVIYELSKYSRVKEIMNELNYSMEENTWI